MSSVTKISSNNSQQITDYSTEKLLHGENKFIKGTVTASGADVEVAVGSVMARVASTGKIVHIDADATDGSQYPVGIAIHAKTIADGSSGNITMVNKGSINQGLLSFGDDSTLDTTAGPTSNKRTLRDLINDLGITLVSFTELSANDNS